LDYINFKAAFYFFGIYIVLQPDHGVEVIDRLHFGAVADFFDFHIMGWHYPAFNIADSFISVGIVMLVVNSLFFDQDKKDQTNKKSNEI